MPPRVGLNRSSAKFQSIRAGRESRPKVDFGLVAVLDPQVAEGDAEGGLEVLGERALDAHAGAQRVAVVGIQPLAQCGGLGQQRLIRPEEVGLGEAERRRLLRLRDAKLGAEALPGAEDVAMLPEQLGAGTQIGLVVELGADRARRPLLQLIGDVEPILGRQLRGRMDDDGREQVGVEQPLLAFVHQGGIVALPLLDWHAATQEAGVDAVATGEGDGAEVGPLARLKLQREVHAPGLVIDDGVAVLQGRQREARLARIREQLLLGIEHELGPRRLALDQAEAGRARRRETGAVLNDIDVEPAEQVTRPRLDVEHQHDLRLLGQPLDLVDHTLGRHGAGLLEPEPDRAVEIALGPKCLLQRGHVGLGALANAETAGRRRAGISGALGDLRQQRGQLGRQVAGEADLVGHRRKLGDGRLVGAERALLGRAGATRQQQCRRRDRDGREMPMAAHQALLTARWALASPASASPRSCSISAGEGSVDWLL